ncbi:MAG TPA: 30S ribosomal protein S2 [Candidatus Paceibacterota bacterium]|nr:30S ribosomal protein S2 [Candidatus Paceibacterota bacterium]
MAENQEMTALYDAGTHVGYSRARRHPSAAPFLFGTKDRRDIFDLVQTEARLAAACEFAAALAQKGGQLLFVGGKEEAHDIVRRAAERVGMPFSAARWIGGTLTNFKIIRKRIARFEKLSAERESGELEKYTKRERLLIDREIEKLSEHFGGLVSMHDLPAAMFVIDPKHEETAIAEANQLRIPVIALSSSDCDFALVQYPIPGNDTSVRSVTFVVDAITSAYQGGKRAPAAPARA